MSRTPADAATTTDTTTTDSTTDSIATDATTVPSTSPRSRGLSRRAVVAGAGAVAGIGVLTSCGGGSATAPVAPSAAPEPAPAAPTGGASAPAAAPAAGSLAAVTDIPVGGGAVFADQDVVVTQPTAGDFKAFSATCTHRGCKVNAVADGQIKCPCHASNFAIADGSVISGPAQRPLPAKTVAVEGDSIVLA